MAFTFWNSLCGHNENFTAWRKDDFGPCFEKIALIIPAHVLLAIVSTYHGAQVHRRVSSTNATLRMPWFITLRLVTISLFLILPVAQLMGMFMILEVEPSIADCVYVGLVSLTWLLHGIYTYNLKHMYWETYRGPLCVVLFYLLTFVSDCLHCYSVIRMHLSNSPFHNSAEEYCVYVTIFCHLLYIFTLKPTGDRLMSDSYLRHSLNISPSETERLMFPGTTGYGSITSPQRTVTVAEDGSSFLSKLTFHWVQPLMVKGYKQLIRSASDLYLLPNKLNTKDLEDKFLKILSPSRQGTSLYDNEESSQGTPLTPDVYIRSGGQNTGHTHQQTPTMLRALHKAFGLEYYLLGILKLMADSVGFAGPMLLNLLVTYIENKEEPEQHGYLYASGLLLSTLIGSLCSSQFDYHCRNVGFKMRCAIITTIYRKALSVGSVSISKFSMGEIVNFMSTDTDRMVNFCPSFHAVWSLPFQIGVSLYLLYLQVGIAFLAGLGFALLLIPINRWLANKIGELSKDMMKQKDARVKMMNEVLFGMRIIKFYTWENHFRSEIQRLRNAELKSLKGRKYLDAMCVYFWATTPVLISILTFTTYSLMGNTLTAARVFTSLSLFMMLISPLNAFPWVINGLMEAWVSLKRVQAYVALTDMDMRSYYKTSEDLYSAERIISIKSGRFSWKNELCATSDAHVAKRQDNQSVHGTGTSQSAHGTGTTQSAHGNETNHSEHDKSTRQSGHDPATSQSGTLKLRNINIDIEQGQFIGVIGKVGSGKSSLLQALMAEMCREAGQISLRDLHSGFALVAQEAWIQHATIRDNILFGQPFNTRKYESVLEAAALNMDLQMLPAGDKTEVGENGVTLSGGQKARVSLARALYQDKEVYLLDDPLAAVDAHVAQHLYDRCIMGLLRNKTRILCTHHTKFLGKADLVIVMDDGVISNIGPPSEVLEDTKFADNQVSDEDKEWTDGGPETDQSGGGQDGTLVGEEEKETGVVKLSVYKSYWRAVGKCLAPSVLLALLFMQASRNINDWWLSYWVSNSNSTTDSNPGNTSQSSLTMGSQFFFSGYVTSAGSDVSLDNNSSNSTSDGEDNVKFYLTVYGCLAGANSLFTLARAFLFAYGGICAARILHHELLETILQAPMSFFDVTPIGRILNRFSSDLYAVDDSLPFIMNIFLAQLFGILGTIIITCYGLPWFALLLVPLGAIYYKIQQYYRQTSREIKRISSITLSPMYAHFSETVSGLVTIRAFRQTPRFQTENLHRLDLNQRAQFVAGAVGSWLGFRLQMMGVIMVAGIAFIAVLQHHFQTVNPGLVGLAISYALSVTNLLSGVVNSFTETEKQMVSVERVQQYLDNIPKERWEGSLFVSATWPDSGVIRFKEVCLKYRQGLPYALNRISFNIYSAEKLGIVGRTGSGKSSLFLALFRIVEISRGEILIDGMNIQHLDLTDVRRHLAVIPQDPFLFSGTVRENLDPTSCYSDEELWGVLDRCHLRLPVDRLGGLEGEVAEKGRHFSVGQRQLMCLARALLTKAKVLCIDEATASVDLETDMLIQETIRQEFVNSTVLTIAHRINTIMDSDRVLVMDQGQVAELDSPRVLLQNSQSLFYKLVNGES
ncbi:multidrug resistance-associated protein 7-like isoform X1 [Mizuhopecten yessoensis]|uniref:multidrug resistance-associated protein 7-like isoform X1 n=1 Tax=Mizuhopecten yessoensis TaxID=6573 RepID=UPI000B45EB26|nr:multidrug resistance-associated protein 7-like isoform X1 [Mizuhopecten yessoensis]XP_021347495.1 multidrug resistance-associated protein 7-like isoform X1 [Mizuhopecten yessoensis]XP_021347496.1 multidrug resistance-associated protein 7-like isoform X1 [Mizuhopecten yessoensis]XP_021347497.1 multidrug resistance-associated protein 7-like isoform X1 [Mizuhopecten yessoensis]